MPEPQHPPYGVGSVSPRQLNRWLDCNSQNGPLTRTRGYVSLPAFNIPSAGRSYSEIVGVYSYVATNNFSIKNYRNLSNNGSYSLCISYANSDLSVVRYILVRGTSDNNLSYPPIYAGQMIKKRFRLEVWDGTDHADCINESEVKTHSSVLGSLDYRYGVDFVLGNSSILCTSQGNTNGAPNAQLPQTNLQLWLRAILADLDLDVNSKVINWHDQSPSALVLTQAVAANRPLYQADIVPAIGGEIRFLGGRNLSAALAHNLVHLYILITPNVGTANANGIVHYSAISFDIFSGDGVGGTNFAADFNGNLETINYSLPDNNALYPIYVLEVVTQTSGAGGARIATLHALSGSPISNDGPFAFSFASNPATFNIGDTGGLTADGYLLYGVVGYSQEQSSADRILTLQYLYSLVYKPNLWTLPLTYADCTVETVNT